MITNPDDFFKLELESSQRSIVMPRMTTQEAENPALWLEKGDLYYDIDLKVIKLYFKGKWYTYYELLELFSNDPFELFDALINIKYNYEPFKKFRGYD